MDTKLPTLARFDTGRAMSLAFGMQRNDRNVDKEEV
jgi:hypothetical protein